VDSSLAELASVCSNPSKSPDRLGKPPTREYRYLQQFCKLQNPLANYLSAFTRQRSLVRTQHRPLSIHCIITTMSLSPFRLAN